MSPYSSNHFAQSMRLLAGAGRCGGPGGCAPAARAGLRRARHARLRAGRENRDDAAAGGDRPRQAVLDERVVVGVRPRARKSSPRRPSATVLATACSVSPCRLTHGARVAFSGSLRIARERTLPRFAYAPKAWLPIAVSPAIP